MCPGPFHSRQSAALERSARNGKCAVERGPPAAKGGGPWIPLFQAAQGCDGAPAAKRHDEYPLRGGAQRRIGTRIRKVMGSKGLGPWPPEAPFPEPVPTKNRFPHANAMPICHTMASQEIETLMQALARLPGLGPRSARRAVLWLVKRRETALAGLLDALAEVRDRLVECETCGNVDTTNPCGVCADPRRDSRSLCVVEDVADLWALDRARLFTGRYHVLGGRLSALDGGLGLARGGGGHRGGGAGDERHFRRADHRALYCRKARKTANSFDATCAWRACWRRIGLFG